MANFCIWHKQIRQLYMSTCNRENRTVVIFKTWTYFHLLVSSPSYKEANFSMLNSHAEKGFK